MRQYSHRHQGTAIVCGASPRLFEDLANARALRPNAALLGCNEVPALVPEITHVWTQEARIGKIWRSKLKDGIFVHAAKGPQPGMEAIYDADYIWPELDWVCGTSGFSAGLWARHGMGFDEVILAGVSLSKNIGGYADGYPSAIGAGANQPGYSDELFDHWMRQVRTHHKNGKTQGIYSMSGATAQLLGYPKENDFGSR